MGWGPKKPSTKNLEALAKTQQGLALEDAATKREELAYQRERNAKMDPLFEQIVGQSIASQKTQDDRSAQQWQQYQDVFMPAERRLADTAANYDTQGRRDEAAAEAVAGVDAQFARGREGLNQELGRRGISLSGGRALTLDAASRFGQAKAAVGAENAARKQVEATGMSLTDNVVKTGRGIASTGLQAAQLALGAGSGAAGQLGQQQNTYNASLQPALQFGAAAQSGLANAGQSYGQIANMQQQAYQSGLSGLGGLGSLAGSLAMAPVKGGGSLFGNYFSDPKTKTVHGKVKPEKALLKLESADVYDWTYKPEHGDGKRHVGRMATKDDHTGEDGLHRIDVISEIGTHHAAIKQLAKEVRRLGLADAEDAKITRRTA